MKFITCIFLLFAVSMYANEISNKEAYQRARKIQNDQKKLFECELSNEEILEATRFDLKQNNISVSTFSDAANQTRVLVDALRLVVVDGKDKDMVFSEMELKRLGITEENWKYYTTNYRTKEKIAKLEEMIPDTEDKIVEQFSKPLRPILENWLLETKILMDFDNKNPGKQELPNSQKLFCWWENALKKYDIKPEDSKIIIQFLSRESSLPPQDQKYWHSYFEKKLKK
ncbi:MAG: hypothetical protein GX561_09260 [Lentisphaerae bacterium]|jgi:hypothetical protein|nr:hypothetical protein [Lentisphaerota bacterium]